MATKKLQTFVKNIGSGQPNKSLQLTKSKNKIDAQEDLFIFETLDSDKEEGDNNDEFLINIYNSKSSNNTDSNTICNPESKGIDDYDIICDQEGKASPINATTLRGRTGFIGKSVNTALKDAHIAINAMKESMKKKGIRKPSEVAKDPRKRKRMAAILREYQESDNEKVLNFELPTEVEEPHETAPIDDHQEILETDVNLSDTQPSSLKENSNTLFEGKVESVIMDSTEFNTVEYTLRSTDLPPQHNNIYDPKLILGIGGAVLLLFLFAISKFILGLICGVIMSFGGLKIYESFFSTAEDMPLYNKTYPHLRDLRSPVIPHVEEEDRVDEYASAKASYSAWVNAVNVYHPSYYNISATYSLHLSIEGTLLRMRKPKNKVSSRAMSTDLKISGVTIVGESTLELLHAKIHLLPYGLVHKRMWSKRYPICVTVKKTGEEKYSRAAITTSKSPDALSSAPPNDEENFYFFARTCREKEEMFRRLMAASLGMPINLTISDIVEKYLSKEVFSNQPMPLVHAHDICESNSTNQSKDDGLATNQRGVPRNVINCKEPQLVTYVRYMAKFMPSDTLLTMAKSHHIDLNYISCESELLWLNALVGRLAWEVFRGGHWVKVIREKIQRKLKKLHLPYFIDQLAIVDIDLGTELPVVRKVSRPYLDYRGLWVEFELEYAGGFSMGLETKINLLKLKKVANQQKSTGGKVKKSEFTAKYCVETETCSGEHGDIDDMDADNISSDVSIDAKMQMNMCTGGGAVLADDDEGDGDGGAMLSTDESYASSSESELPDDKSQGLPQASSNKSLLQWVDKIAKSSYFLKAADNKYVLKTMEYVSNTSLQLQVDTHYLNGTMAINIPPPPSDRLWWGFKHSPQLNIKARPKVGQKEIQMTKLVEFIEKKLLQEFHRAAVLPNMDDISIPLLFNSNAEKYSQSLS